MAAKRIMICDDEPAVHESLRYYLQPAGFMITSVYRGDDAVTEYWRTKPDLIVLDIMMPGLSGTDACAQIRRTSQVPIILLTARGDEIDRLLGFELGADDYIVKPFSPRELVSRIKVIFRRLDQLDRQGGGIRVTGNTVVNIRRYEVAVDGEIIPLSPKEVEIIYMLTENLSQVFSRDQLIDAVWGLDFDGDSRVVDTLIKRIRKKLPGQSDLVIRSVYGVGYKAEKVNHV
jgi:DNA-binding response OmpR family regulator